MLGKRVDFPFLLSLKMDWDEDAPAHSLAASFAVDAPAPRLARVEVLHEGVLVFRGIVDQQDTKISPQGNRLRLVARSLAALLLDNEALPQTYINPSLRGLFERHARPYGFPSFAGNGGAFRGKLTVEKGMSEWQVLQGFCDYFLGASLSVRPDGVLDAAGDPPKGLLRFSNTDGIPYQSVTHQDFFCRRIQEIWLQAGVGTGYQGHVVDAETAGLGIQRKRYKTATNYQGTSVLRKSRRQAEECTLSCLGWVPAQLGMEASLADPFFGESDGWTVAKCTYQQSQAGESTCCVLRKKLQP